MHAWRLCASKYADEILSGEGARQHGGRWNSPGVPVIYAGENLSLCALETLVHITHTIILNGDFKCIQLDIPDDLVHTITEQNLPANWYDKTPLEDTQKIGDKWIKFNTFLAMKVPSAVVLQENNIVINPLHPDFKEIKKVGTLQGFRFDPRVVKQAPTSPSQRAELVRIMKKAGTKGNFTTIGDKLKSDK